jgi:hypothetical protein
MDAIIIVTPTTFGKFCDIGNKKTKFYYQMGWYQGNDQVQFDSFHYQIEIK